MEYIWIYLCIAASFLAALTWGLNGIFRANPVRLAVYRSFYVTLMLSPLLFFVELPEDKMFYIGFFLIGVIGIIVDIIIFKVVKDYKGSGPTRVLNLRVPLTIVIGWFIFPESWSVIASQSLLVELLVILCLAITLGSLFFMTKNPIAAKVLYLMLAPIIIVVCTDLFTKVLLSGEGLSISHTFVSTWIVALGMLVSSLFVAKFTKTKLYDTSEPIFKYSFYIMLSWLSLMSCKQLAMFYIENPGYYSLFVGLSCLWIMLYHKIKKEKDESSPIAGLLLLVSASILIVIVS